MAKTHELTVVRNLRCSLGNFKLVGTAGPAPGRAWRGAVSLLGRMGVWSMRANAPKSERCTGFLQRALPSCAGTAYSRSFLQAERQSGGERPTCRLDFPTLYGPSSPELVSLWPRQRRSVPHAVMYRVQLRLCMNEKDVYTIGRVEKDVLVTPTLMQRVQSFEHHL